MYDIGKLIQNLLAQQLDVEMSKIKIKQANIREDQQEMERSRYKGGGTKIYRDSIKN